MLPYAIRENSHLKLDESPQAIDRAGGIGSGSIQGRGHLEPIFRRHLPSDELLHVFEKTDLQFRRRSLNRQQRAKGSSYQATLRALAFKWIRIVYRCWKTSTVYDEKDYLQALTRRGSTLLEAPMEVVTG